MLKFLVLMLALLPTTTIAQPMTRAAQRQEIRQQVWEIQNGPEIRPSNRRRVTGLELLGLAAATLLVSALNSYTLTGDDDNGVTLRRFYPSAGSDNLGCNALASRHAHARRVA